MITPVNLMLSGGGIIVLAVILLFVSSRFFSFSQWYGYPEILVSRYVLLPGCAIGVLAIICGFIWKMMQ